jgi:acetyl-CoA synthetase
LNQRFSGDSRLLGDDHQQREDPMSATDPIDGKHAGEQPLEAQSGERRLRELLNCYEGPDVCLAGVLCDDHPAGDVALRIVDADLNTREVTYGELRERSERFASALAGLGVGPGDRVATLMGKSLDLVTAVLAIWRRGAVHVPLFTAFAPPAIELRLRSSAAKVVIVDPGQREKLDAVGAGCRIVTAGDQARVGDLTVVELLDSHPAGIAAETVAGDDPFIMIFTSGTTGTPKGVPAPVSFIAGVRLYLEYGLGVTEDDVYWTAADPGWAYGLYCAIVAPFAAGLTTTLLTAAFDPTLTWRVLDRLEVTNFAAAPTAYRALRAAGADRPEGLALRCLSSAGEPLDPDTLDWAREALGVEIRDHYGQTELGMVVANGWHPDIRGPLKTGSMGTQMPGWTVEVLREDREEIAPSGELGRVAIDIPNSPAMSFSGYHEAPEKTAERITADGRWYLAGDTASRDNDGYFFFSSRDDDVIIMGGYRIGPFEVESVLGDHPDVAEAAVVGVPDELRGEVIEAFVALRPGADASDALVVELQQHVKTRFAAHAYPRTVHFVDALPRTPSGKVQRFVLRDRRRAELAANR